MDEEETETDVKWFGATSSNSSVVNSEPHMEQPGMQDPNMEEPLGGGSGEELRVPFNKYDRFYNMDGNKYLHVFNHFEYEENDYYGYGADVPEKRWGTHEDVKVLKTTFEGLGFKVRVHQDLRYAQVLEVMTKVGSMDHSATSCVAVAVMTHGHNGGVLAARDRLYLFKEVTDALQNGHPSLVGKPKLFFVQACRSGHKDLGRPVPGTVNEVLPTHADTLVVYSSSPHYYSYRNSSGTWLMQSLCKVLDQDHQFYDLGQMLPFVQAAVADKSTNKMKQMPVTKHTFTKLLKL